jgi:hypothetical protein
MKATARLLTYVLLWHVTGMYIEPGMAVSDHHLNTLHLSHYRDAAYATTPHQSPGAGMAFEDSFILSSILG